MAKPHVSMSDRQLIEFERTLRLFAAKAQPHAVRGMLNTAAFQTQKEARNTIKSRMVIRARGKFGAVGSVLVNRTVGLNVRTMRSATGSIAGYMADQEFGGSKATKGKRGVPIPTTSASGEGRGARPRRRVPRRGRALRNIRLSSRRNNPKGGALSRNRKAFIAVKLAQQKGDEFVFLDLQRAPGIYRVTRQGINLIYETKRTSVTIPRNPWLKPSVDKVRPRMPAIWQKELKRQLLRRGIKWRLRQG